MRSFGLWKHILNSSVQYSTECTLPYSSVSTRTTYVPYFLRWTGGGKDWITLSHGHSMTTNWETSVVDEPDVLVVIVVVVEEVVAVDGIVNSEGKKDADSNGR